ncbi:tRNA guanosine(34) transglycosylase Tgt [Endomicrobium sp. AH-315-J14]|nr:tRNA guanosine(34) transglycosylase Tgt [Endomicrobium sp. AH-315-J14]
MSLAFEVTAQDGEARAGRFSTTHGEVSTPTFMPVGTRGSVRTLSMEEVASTGAQVVLGNTYHLWTRPGPELVAELGGLHEFSRWPRAMLTDSGGFQAFSLKDTRLSDDGFTFRSHVDGTKLDMTPEESMRIQTLLGADIVMQLDVCPPGVADEREMAKACRLTSAWARRCIDARPPDQALFGIVQGGTDVKLRLDHAEDLAGLPFDGLALGGFSVGEPMERMHEVLAEVAPQIDPARPRYLMGVGTPADLVRGVGAGIDMFDCVMPTRNARNGHLFTSAGKLAIKNSRYRNDSGPLDPECSCLVCAPEGFSYSRAYLRHLFLTKEMLALRMFSLHNLHYYGNLMRRARAAIEEGRFQAFAAEALAVPT